MRLLLSSHGANLYGAERVVLALAGGLSARGHQVVLEIPHRGPIDGCAAALPGVEVLYTGRPKPPRGAARALGYALSSPAAAAGLAREIRSRDIDLVWVNSLVNPIAASAARLARAPALWHLHERCFPGLAGRAAECVVGMAAVALAVSSYVADSYPRTLRGGRLGVLPNALLADISPTPLAAAGGELAVGYVGQLKPRKRAHELVQALARVPHTRGVVVGDGPDRGMIERLVGRLGLRDRVAIQGFRADVRSFYSEVDCVVIPAVDEPFGLVALEAMAAGRPVIAARSGALPEVLGDAALYYPPGGVGELALQIERLRLSPELGRELRGRGLERTALFGVERWLDRAEEFAHLAVGPRPRGAPRGAPRAAVVAGTPRSSAVPGVLRESDRPAP